MTGEEQRDRNLDVVDRARRAQLAVDDILGAKIRDPHNHQPRQHRDGKPPWCDICKLTADHTIPVSRLDKSPKEDSERVTSSLQLIGIGGHYEAGKDGWADQLVLTHGYEKTWMSRPLHEWLLTQNPWIKLDVRVFDLEGYWHEPGEFVTYAWLDYNVGYVEAKRQREVRDQLQKVGTNCGRKLLYWDVWVDAMKKQIEEWVTAGRTKLIVTGIRYPNELKAIMDLGGDTVWIERPEATAKHEQRLREDSERVAQGLPPLVHDSDTSLVASDFSSLIMNDSDLDELKRRAELWHVMRYGS